ncbi:MAG: hypothetical protein PWP65_1118 [Clostridia bacterium]|nr:hypothetical protein [Clostridia bacterium]
MRSIRKISWVLILGLVVALVVAGCGGKGQAPQETSKGQQEAQQKEQQAEKKADDFPTKPIQILCASKAGSPVDVMARTLAKHAEKYLGQPITVVQKTGGSTANQQAAMLAAPADGYTLGTVTPSAIGAWNTNLKGQFSMDQYDFIVRVQADPYVVVVNANSPFKTLKDMVEWAKQNPGKLKAGGFGSTGSGHNVAFNLLAKAANMPFTWMPFDGGSEAVAAVLGGHIDVCNTNPGNVLQHVQAGKLRVLGVMYDERLDALPDVPTYKEAGYDVDTSWIQWRGIFAKKGIPKERIDKLADAFLKAIKEPEFQKYLKDTNQLDGSMGPEEFTAAAKKTDKILKEILAELEMKK